MRDKEGFAKDKLLQAVKTALIPSFLTFISTFVFLVAAFFGKSPIITENLAYYALLTFAPWVLSSFLSGFSMGLLEKCRRKIKNRTVIRVYLIYSMSSVLSCFFPILFFASSIFVPVICGALYLCGLCRIFYLCREGPYLLKFMLVLAIIFSLFSFSASLAVHLWLF